VIYLTIEKEEVIMNQEILHALSSNSRISTVTNKHLSRGTRGFYREYCPVCKCLFKVGDKAIRTNMSKYVHVGCYSIFRYDSDMVPSDSELEDFFNITEFMPSVKESRKHKAIA
jgi:hypothetical protein